MKSLTSIALSITFITSSSHFTSLGNVFRYSLLNTFYLFIFINDYSCLRIRGMNYQNDYYKKFKI